MNENNQPQSQQTPESAPINFYGNKPHEKALQQLIHDTNAALSGMRHHTKEISLFVSEAAKTYKEAGKTIPSAPFVHIEYLKSNTNALMKALDSYYEFLKS